VHRSLHQNITRQNNDDDDRRINCLRLDSNLYVFVHQYTATTYYIVFLLYLPTLLSSVIVQWLSSDSRLQGHRLNLWFWSAVEPEMSATSGISFRQIVPDNAAE